MQNMCIYIYIRAHTHTHARIHRHTDTHAGVIQSCWLSGCWRCWGVNLYLVALSGCLRGRLIKGNEMLWGLFSTDSYWTLCIPSCLPHRGWEQRCPTVGPGWTKPDKQGPCPGTHVREDMPVCQSQAIWRKKKFISKTKSVTTVDDWSSDIFGWWKLKNLESP